MGTIALMRAGLLNARYWTIAGWRTASAALLRQPSDTLRRQNIGTFVKAGVLGVVFSTLAGVGIVSVARAAMHLLGVASH